MGRRSVLSREIFRLGDPGGRELYRLRDDALRMNSWPPMNADQRRLVVVPYPRLSPSISGYLFRRRGSTALRPLGLGDRRIPSRGEGGEGWSVTGPSQVVHDLEELDGGPPRREL